MIQNIQALLTRYSFQPTERMLRREVATIIHAATRLPVTEDQLYVQDTIILLRVRPAMRSELMLHQVEILTELRKNKRTAHIVALR